MYKVPIALAALLAPAFGTVLPETLPSGELPQLNSAEPTRLDWVADNKLDEAKTRAEAEGKLLLVVVHGSEWTRSQMKIRERILDDPVFMAYAQDKFVPIEMVEPRDRAREAEAVLRHRAFSREYGVRLWPTTLVMRPDGVVTGGNMGVPGYGSGYMHFTHEDSLNIMMTALDNAILVAEKLKEAEAMPEGEDKLRCMASAYFRIPEKLGARYVLAKRVMEMDADDVTGIRNEYLAFREIEDFKEIGRYSLNNPAPAIRKMQEAVDKAMPVNRTAMLQYLYNFRCNYLETEEDVLALRQNAEALAAALEASDPAAAAKLRQSVETYYSGDPAEVLARVREAKEKQRREQERRKKEREAQKGQ